jgi:hypothetical protein
LAVATFGLELANERLTHNWTSAREFVELACEVLRPNPPGDSERTWYRASIALAERAQDWDLLRSPDGSGPLLVARTRTKAFDHLRHALDAFPDDMRLRLAPMRVFALRQTPGWPRQERDDVRLSPIRMANRADAIRALAPFTVDSEVGAEASLWIGLLQMVGLDQANQALRHFDIAAASDDAFVEYLGHLFAARVLSHELGDDAAAAARLRAALGRLSAQSAALGLAVLRTNDGAVLPREATEALSYSPEETVDDPWVTYGFGDYRYWKSYLKALRGAVTPK